jgi:anthranilate phosphoribosyltransferase
MIREAIARVVEGQNLTMEEMTLTMEEITSGQATPAQIASLMTALRLKGETVEEITAAAQVMRNKAVPIQVAGPQASDAPVLVDTCGTGGDQIHTFNISTAAAFVVAGAGVRVAKHGNRSVSSTCGSADVCEALGVCLDLPPEGVAACIREQGIGFLFAPALHGTMKHAVAPRKEIGIRTIFNILGPLANPAGAEVQILGVFRKDLTAVMAEVLGKLGCRRAMVVHGEDGMDEITTTGVSHVAEWVDGEVRQYTVHPEDFGIPVGTLEELRGGDAKENARIILELFDGRKGGRQDIVLLNAGAALYAAGRADSIQEGIELARQTIDNGGAMDKLQALIRHSNRKEKAGPE